MRCLLGSVLMLLSFFSTFAGPFASEEDVMMVERIHNLRLKQQEEEGAIRIQKFVQTNKQRQCSVEQQVRQRLREIGTEGGGSDGMSAENITINAGHGELDIAGNHGTISSDVNIQIIEQAGEANPCP